MAVTLKQIANQTGVAQATVSQILNRKPNDFSSAETRRRIFAAAKQLGYKQRFIDKVRRGDPTNTVAIIYHGDEILNFLTMILLKKFKNINYAAYVINVQDKTECLDQVRELSERGCHRFVFLNPPFQPDDINTETNLYDVESEIMRRNCTYAAYSSWFQRNIIQDFGAAVEETLSFFFAEGKKDFKMLLPPDQKSSRHDGLYRFFPELSHKEVLDRYVIPIGISCYVDLDARVDYGYKWTHDVLTEFPKTQALYYASDDWLLGGLNYLVEKGIHPGRDILLAGFNDIPGIRHGVYPISSAAHDYEAIADWLVAESGNTGPMQQKVPPRVFIRKY